MDEKKAREIYEGVGKTTTYLDLREAIRARAAQATAALVAEFPGCTLEVVEELFRAGNDATIDWAILRAQETLSERGVAEEIDESDETWGADDDAD